MSMSIGARLRYASEHNSMSVCKHCAKSGWCGGYLLGTMAECPDFNVVRLAIYWLILC